MDLLYQLLGVDLEAGRPRPEGLLFVRPWPVWVAGAALLAVTAWVVIFYMRDGTRARRWGRVVPALLRVGVIALLGLLLWQPALYGRRVDVTRSLVAVLLDDSRSMNLADTWRDAQTRQEIEAALGSAALPRTRAANAAALLNREDGAVLRELMKRHPVRIYRFGEGVESSELRAVGSGADHEGLPVAPPKAAGEETRLGGAIQAVLDDAAGQPLAGMVVLTDGGQNMGEDPVAAAGRAGELGAPVYTVGLGDPTPPRDIAVSTLLVDEVLRKDDQAVVSTSIRSRGFGGRTLPITLRLGDRVVARQNVKLSAEDGLTEATLLFKPTQAGAQTIRIEFPPQPGETSSANNHRLAPVRVVDHRLRILYVEGQPRWEYRYLKNAILRDRRILFSCLLSDADPASGGEGNVPLYGFPNDRKKLFEHDIIIIGDVPREYFTTADLENVRAFVEERGGSLVVLAGERSMPWEYRTSPLNQVLPVLVPASRREILFREPFQLELTAAGARHPMLLLETDFARNRNLWHSLPGMYWCAVVDGVKPGATVLAQHPTQQSGEGNLPLMVLQQVGEGFCFTSLVDSTWQWRFRVGDRYFYRFWGQVVRSLTPNELPGANRFVRLTSDRPLYNLGETVTLRARLLTPAYRPLRAASVSGEVIGKDGQRHDIRLEPAGTAGVFTGTWTPPKPGTYRAVVQGPSGASGESLTGFVVEQTSPELEEPQQNRDLLKRIAEASGGAYLKPGEFEKLPELLPERRQETRSRVEYPLWQAPLALALITLMLTGEWALRKRAGLL